MPELMPGRTTASWIRGVSRISTNSFYLIESRQDDKPAATPVAPRTEFFTSSRITLSQNQGITAVIHRSGPVQHGVFGDTELPRRMHLRTDAIYRRASQNHDPHSRSMDCVDSLEYGHQRAPGTLLYTMDLASAPTGSPPRYQSARSHRWLRSPMDSFHGLELHCDLVKNTLARTHPHLQRENARKDRWNDLYSSTGW